MSAVRSGEGIDGRIRVAVAPGVVVVLAVHLRIEEIAGLGHAHHRRGAPGPAETGMLRIARIDLPGPDALPVDLPRSAEEVPCIVQLRARDVPIVPVLDQLLLAGRAPEPKLAALARGEQ